jgi:hypothetical protein
MENNGENGGEFCYDDDMENVDLGATNQTFRANVEEILSKSRAQREIDNALKSERVEQERIARRPHIDHLEDAISIGEDGQIKFLAHVGDRIVIERWYEHKGRPAWLDTKKYLIKEIHEVEKKNKDGWICARIGDLSLFNIENENSAGSNYITGHAAGYKFRIDEQGARLRSKEKTLKHIEKKEAKKISDQQPKTRKVYEGRLGGLVVVIKGNDFRAPDKSQAKKLGQVEIITYNTSDVIVKFEDGSREIWNKVIASK